MKKLVEQQLFPQKIKQYSLFRVLSHLTSRSHYLFAIYKDSKGNKYFCKLWASEKKDQNYSWICNEIKVYESFSNIYKKYGKEIIDNFPQIHIPRMFYHHITDNKVLLLTEFVEGVSLGEEDDETQVQVFEYIIQYFHFISKYIKKEGKAVFHISNIFLFLLFHYYLLKVILHQSLSFGNLWTSVRTFYAALPSLLFTQNYSFVHRDLGFADNIILHKEKIYLIDFQLSVLTNPYFELANITVAQWDDKRFKKYFFDSLLMKSLLTKPNEKRQYKAFVAYAFLVSTALALDEGVFGGNFMKQTQFTHSI